MSSHKCHFQEDDKVIARCDHLEYDFLLGKVMTRCPIANQPLERLPDGEYTFRVKDGKIIDCPLGVWKGEGS